MIIGLTGGIGTGKSTVLKLLKEKYGFVVFETDKIGHEVMNEGHDAYQNIVKYFGEGILSPDRTIDRRKLSDIVFKDKEKLERLNAIIHPAVICEIEAGIKECRDKYKLENFVIESAILIESGCDKICDKVWYVYADEAVRIERLIRYRNMTREKIDEVMKNQLKKEDFIKNTSVIIDNSNTVENTDKQIEKLLEF